MSQPVSVQVTGGIAVLTVDLPPRNELSGEVRAALAHALGHVDAASDTRAIVLAARGKGFMTGVDPDDTADAALSPRLAELAARIEACRRPVVAALHGQVAGAGLELALAAHYRIADRRAEIGFPGIRLGLTPCAGGTQRLPRLIGIAPALDLLGNGRLIGAKPAARLGLVDAVAEGPLPTFVLDWIRARLAAGMKPRRAGDQSKALEPAETHLGQVRTARKALDKAAEPARAAILDCLEAALVLPYEAAIVREAAIYGDCLGSDTSRALRHVARAEDRARIPPVEIAVRPRKISRVGVVGAGRIGRGVVALCLDAGYEVTLVEKDIDHLEEAVEAIIDVYDQEIAAKRIDALTRDRRIGRLTGKIEIEALASADLVIEATPDDAGGKRRVFAALDAVMKRGAILATTTSGLDLDGLAAGTGRADRVIGLHFFPPVYRMRTAEVVMGAATGDAVVATAFEVLTRMDRIPVATAVSEGYLAMRMAAALVDAAVLMVLRGATVPAVDAALEGYGFAVGPLKLADAIGLDVLQGISRPHGSKAAGRIHDALTRMVAAKLTGRRTGRGFYIHSGAESRPNPAAADLVADLGVKPKTFGESEIRRRTLAALANQGAHLVHDAMAQRPSDLDVLMVQVFGFPRRCGGPMMAADIAGLDRVKRDLDALAREVPELWKPVPLWADLIDSGRDFASLNG